MKPVEGQDISSLLPLFSLPLLKTLTARAKSLTKCKKIFWWSIFLFFFQSLHSGCENDPIDLEGLHESVVDSDEDLADSMDVSIQLIV